MSILSEAMYGSLQEAVDIMQHSNSLEETQGALINALNHIIRLESRVAALENPRPKKTTPARKTVRFGEDETGRRVLLPAEDEP